MKLDRICDHTFVSHILCRDSVVFDLGANRGAFGLTISKKYGCSVIGAEPVPALFDSLPRKDRVHWFPYAIAGQDGESTLHINPISCASLNEGLAEKGAEIIRVQTRSFDSFLLETLPEGVIDLVKVDIEGAEVPMFEGVSEGALVRVRMFTVEFHDFLNPLLSQPVKKIVEGMKDRGFFCVSWSRRNTDVLFVNEKVEPLTFLERSELRATKYFSGLRRVASRGIRRRRFADLGLK